MVISKVLISCVRDYMIYFLGFNIVKLYFLGETFAGLSVLPLSGSWCNKISANINATNALC